MEIFRQLIPRYNPTVSKSVPRFVFLRACLCCSVSVLASAADSPRTATGSTIETASSQFQLPKPTGPYGVGRVSYAFADRSRPEPLARRAGGVRQVMIEVWYPTEAGLSEHSNTAPYLPGFDVAKPKMSQDDIKDLFSPATYSGSLPETHTVESATIARGNRKFPLLV